MRVAEVGKRAAEVRGVRVAAAPVVRREVTGLRGVRRSEVGGSRGGRRSARRAEVDARRSEVGRAGAGVGGLRVAGSVRVGGWCRRGASPPESELRTRNGATMCAPLRSAHCPVPQRSAYPPAAMASVPTRCVMGMGERQRGRCSASGRAEVRGGVTSSSPCGLPSNGSGHGIPVDAAPGSGRGRHHQDRRLPPSPGSRHSQVRERIGRRTHPAEHQSHPPRPGRSGG